MSDYTPTTEDIRTAYIKYTQPSLSDSGQLFYGDKTEFDRWLAGVKAQVWDEGFDAGERDVHEHELTHWDDSDCIQNPYRQED